MKKKILFLSMIIMVILISGCNEDNLYPKNENEEIKINKSTDETEIKEDNQTINEKIYDWNIEVILCKECSPYKAESISQDELERIKDEFISNFEKGEVIFDKFRSNGFYVNVTNEAKDKIGNAKITGARLSTLYFNLIINEEVQKEPSENEEIYQCNEDRECISVSSGCCGCNSGGTATAINRDYLNFWDDKLSNDCKGMSCIAVMSQHISCFSKPTCVNNACKLIPNKDYVCNSLLLANCRVNTPEERWDEIQRGNGISCREVIEICE